MKPLQALVVALLVACSSAEAATGKWVSGYYAGWFHDWHSPEDAIAAVDMTALTHFIFGRYAPGGGTLGGACGTLVLGAGSGHQIVEQPLIAKAHAAGKKALLMLGGAGDGPGFDCSTKPALRAQFIGAIVSKVAEKGYDGVDVDWEENFGTPAQQRQVLDFLTELRAAKPSMVLTFPAFWTSINFPTITAWHVAVAALVDQYNLMTYSMAGTWTGWVSWHHSPLKDAQPTHPTSIEASVSEYVTAGVPKSKLGIGIGTYGIYYSNGPVTAPRQPLGLSKAEGNDVENATRNLIAEGAFKQPNGTVLWDVAAQQSYVSYSPPWFRYGPSGPAIGYLSFEDRKSIAAKGQWVKANGLGGTIVWTINYGCLVGTTINPLMAAVKKAFL